MHVQSDKPGRGSLALLLTACVLVGGTTGIADAQDMPRDEIGISELAQEAVRLMKAAVDCPKTSTRTEMTATFVIERYIGDEKVVDIETDSYTIGFGTQEQQEEVSTHSTRVDYSMLEPFSSFDGPDTSYASASCKGGKFCVDTGGSGFSPALAIKACDVFTAENIVTAGNILISLNAAHGTQANTDFLSRSKSIWDHNGSMMALAADGPARQFFYSEPRAALIEQGVRPGDLLFEGARQAGQYVGTAFVFKLNCPPAGYKVRGTVSQDQTHVTLKGTAPRRDDSCQIIGYRDDVMEFTYQRLNN